MSCLKNVPFYYLSKKCPKVLCLKSVRLKTVHLKCVRLKNVAVPLLVEPLASHLVPYIDGSARHLNTLSWGILVLDKRVTVAGW